MKTRKNCPVCNSTRVTFSEEGMNCKRCGYTNKEIEKLNVDLKSVRE